MVTNEIRKARAHAVLEQFMHADGKGAIFLTLTTPDVVALDEIRVRWRKFRHELVRTFKRKGLKYVMNYELHPGGHGWHIHAVFNAFLPHRVLLPLARSAGFGRLDFRRVQSDGVAEYLTKHALKAYAMRCRNASNVKRARLVNCSRGLPVLSDWHYESERLNQERHFLRLLIKTKVRPQFCECAELARLAVGVRCRSMFDVLELYSRLAGPCGQFADYLADITASRSRLVQPDLFPDIDLVRDRVNENADRVQAVSAAIGDYRTENAWHDYD